MLDENYCHKKNIAKGEYSKVILVQDRQGKQFIAKILYYTSEASKKLAINLLSNELKSLQILSNLKTIQIIASSFESKFTKKNKTKPCIYLLSNYCPLGPLLNLVKLRPSESICRYFFSLIVSAIESIHQQGVHHLNIRIENILIDSNLNIRFCGFSKSTFTNTSKSLKQNSYSAPEIVSFKGFNGKKVDIFALGVVLFIMVCGAPPFYKASPVDSYFKLFQSNKPAFWKVFPEVSEEVKQLIEGMLAFDENSRFDVQMIKASKWMKLGINRQELVGLEGSLASYN